jgi:cysteine synthase B
MSAMIKVSKKIEEGFLVGIFADDGRKFKSLYSELKLFGPEEYIEAEKRLPPLAYSIDN